MKNLPGLLTFFNDMLQVGHALDVHSGNIFVLSKDGLNLAAKFLEHMWVSHKKTATCSVLAATTGV